MNDGYLWDKTGQPDPEIQQLEEILGTLRYQPRPLRIPVDLRPARRRSYFPALAIAATIVVALLATGVWLRVRSSKEPEKQHAKVLAPQEEKVSMVDPQKDVAPIIKPVVSENNDPTIIRRRNRSSSSGLGKHERAQALAAKDQLMLALRLASEKLNLAHRKTQSTPANQIKNQHRTG